MAEESFSRRQRLLQPRDYAGVFKNTYAREQNSCWVVVRKPNHTLRARLGLAVGKKSARSAVDRNRIKRAARETFRRQGKRLSGWDIVVIARASAAICGNRKLVASLEQLWGRVFAIL